MYMYNVHVPITVASISAASPHQPQQCIPDIVVWMLAGRKRVACTRIPAHKLFYTDGKGRGKLCSKVQTLYLLVCGPQSARLQCSSTCSIHVGCAVQGRRKQICIGQAASSGEYSLDFRPSEIVSGAILR